MTWAMVLLIILGGLLVLMLLGVPIAFAFITVNIIAFSVLMGVGIGPDQFVLSMYDTLAHFSLTPMPLFILMGEILYHSGIATRTLDAISKWLGALPGRLSVLSLLSGTMFATLSGSVLANTAMLGTLLVPEMRERGYSKPMTTGPIMAAGALAMLIPPSGLAVLLGSIANISIGKLLIAGIIPGLLLSGAAIAYIITHCWLHPEAAPVYTVQAATWRERLVSLWVDILPPGVIVFMVIGVILLGIATPTQAAALGAFTSLGLAAVYGRLTRTAFVKSMAGTVRLTGALLLIVGGASGFSQILAFSGVARQITRMVLEIGAPPMMILIAMQLLVLVMGCFLEHVGIMMITLPLFMPVIELFGFDPVWFGVLMLINLDAGNITPPFGLQLFVMKGVAPKDFSMGDIIRSVMPFLAFELAVMALITIFPPLATWLPSLIKGG